MRLDVRERGALVARRESHNVVLRQGAALVAKLFAGAAGAGHVDAVGIGFGTETLGADALALTPPQPAVDPAALRSAVLPAAFTIVTDQPDAIKVTITTPFHPTVELAGVSEAGLFAGTVLYNQVVFDPVDLHLGQDVTFFWEVDFPFDH
jgi:hypothetical protein